MQKVSSFCYLPEVDHSIVRAFFFPKQQNIFMSHLKVILSDLSRSLSLCDLLYKHSCSSPFCRSGRHRGFHTAA